MLFRSQEAAEGGTSIEHRFARAIEKSWMAFQPIVDVTTKRVFAYEALLRTDEESLRRTDIFIATAERLDRVHLLGRTVRAAVARAAAEAPPDVLLFVNVHGLELTDEDLFSADSPLADQSQRVVLEKNPNHKDPRKIAEQGGIGAIFFNELKRELKA